MEKLAQKKEEGLKGAIFTFDIPPMWSMPRQRCLPRTRGENAYFWRDRDRLSHRMSIYERSDVWKSTFYPYARRKVKCKNVSWQGKIFILDWDAVIIRCWKRYAPVYGYEALLIFENERGWAGYQQYFLFVREEIMAGNIEKPIIY